MTPVIELGQVAAIFRYPVKSMAGEALDAATLGWYGLDGDRRLALRRVDERGGMPWLTASKLPALIHYTPLWRDGGVVPSHVRTPDGDELPALGDALAADVERRHGAPVQMMRLDHGIFDETPLSVITSDTADEICRLAGTTPDVRRFRPNVVVRSIRGGLLEEDGWPGGVLTFGDGDDAPTVAVTMRDLRCAMVNLDPGGGPSSPAMMKTVVRLNQNHCGVYGAVTRPGRLAVGQPIFLTPGT